MAITISKKIFEFYNIKSNIDKILLRPDKFA